MSLPASSSSSPLIFGFGSPLLDIQLHTNLEFLASYKLKHGGYTFQGEDQEGIYEDMKSKPGAIYVAGGATLNAMRVCQGLWRKPGGVFYTGCVGKDDYAVKMETLCRTEGLNAVFAKSEENPTGVCAVCIVDKERSLCTRLAAALDFKIHHLEAHWSKVEQAKVFYVAGFILHMCVEGMQRLGKHCSENNKIFSSNLAAPYFVQNFKDELTAVMPYVDILFGNETEYPTFAQTHDWEADLPLHEIATRIAELPKVNASRPRIVIVTQGPLATLVASRWVENGLVKVTKFPVVPLSRDAIVDTNAAGDAFTGGFLYGLAKQMESSQTNSQCSSWPVPDEIDLDYCVHCAHVAARHIVQRDGCSFEFTAEDLEAVSFKVTDPKR